MGRVVIRDFPPDPLPQGCPFSFVSKLQKNVQTKRSEQALLGALKYKTCAIPEDPADQMSREIKDWFAFCLDEKTVGLWGYFNEARYNFKITAGGKKDADPLDPQSQTEGQDQALLEMWNSSGYGLTHYVNEGDDEDLPADAAEGSKQAGYYYYSPGMANYHQLFISANEASLWGFSSASWQYKLAAEASSTIFQIWKGADGSDEQPPAGYAQMYAYDSGAGFSCSKSDDEASTLSHYNLYIKSFDKHSNLFVGGLYLYDGSNFVDIQPPGADCYFQQVEFCINNQTKTAWVLMSEPA